MIAISMFSRAVDGVRRHPLLWLLLCGAATTPGLPAPAIPSLRPNVLLILADDLGYGDVSCFNPHSRIQTPRLDRLAREGIRFTDAHTPSSVCSPTRYGLLTGRYAWRTRLQSGVLGGYASPLIEPKRMTLASLLQDHGYQTACLGKWHLGWTWPGKDGTVFDERAGGKDAQTPNAWKVDWARPIQHGPRGVGFDYYFGISASLDIPPFVFVENERVTAVPTVEKKWIRTGPAAESFEAIEVLPTLTRRAIGRIQEHRQPDTPFFVYLALNSPHTPLVPAANFAGRTGLGAYGDFVVQTDQAVGQVLDALDRDELAKNTLVIFTSDNGCSPAAEVDRLRARGHDPAGPWRGLKSDIWEGGHRVPFIARWPGRIPAGSTSDEIICLTDLLATLADLLRVRLPADAGEDSVSILSALVADERKGVQREALVHHSIHGKFAIRQGPWKLALCAGSGGWSKPADAVASQRGLPPVQLYNLQTDPGETNNLQAQHPEQVQRLTSLLEAFVANGRSTSGPRQSNNVPVDLWKTKSARANRASSQDALSTK